MNNKICSKIFISRYVLAMVFMMCLSGNSIGQVNAPETQFVSQKVDIYQKLDDINKLSSKEDKLDRFQALYDEIIHNGDGDVSDLSAVAISLVDGYMNVGKYKNVLRFINANKDIIAKNCSFEQCLSIEEGKLSALLMLADIKNAKIVMESLENSVRNHDISAPLKSDIYLALAQGYVRTGEYSSGINYITYALDIFNNSPLFDENKRRVKLNVSYTYGGNTYSMMGDYERAIQFYKNALSGYKEGDSPVNRAVVENNIANAYAYMGQWNDALNFATVSAERAKNNGGEAFSAYSLEVSARAKYALGDTEGAINDIDEAVTKFAYAEKFAGVVQSLGYKALFLVNEAFWDLAFDSISTAEKIIEREKIKVEIESLSFYEAAYRAYEKKGDHETALKYHKLWSSISKDAMDALQKQQASKLMMDFEIGLEKERADKFEKEIQLKDVMLQRNQLERIYLILIVLAISIALGLMVIVFYRERMNKLKMESLALTDVLTGAPNRRCVMSQAKKLLSRQFDKEKPLSIALLDLDHFKSINDTYGHDVGDIVLKNFVDIATEQMRGADMIGRYGGEEFVILMPDADEDHLQMIFNRVQSALQKNMCIINGVEKPIAISMSMGAVAVTNMPKECTKEQISNYLDTIMSKADKNVYKAKNKGRGVLVASSLELK